MIRVEAVAPPPSGPSGGTVELGADLTVSSTTYAAVKFKPDGTIETRNIAISGGFVFNRNWISPQVGMDAYELRGTLVSGPVPSSSYPLNTWVTLSAEQVFARVRQFGPETIVVRIQVRRASDQIIVDEFLVTLRITK